MTVLRVTSRTYGEDYYVFLAFLNILKETSEQFDVRENGAHLLWTSAVHN